MKHRILSFVVLLLSFTTMSAEDHPTRFVNTWIGTGGHGHVFLGANVPFGFVQVGPTEHTRGWDWCSGYHYSDSILIGFGHLHLSGTGVGDLGDIAFLPVSKPEQREIRFSHRDETARPGYYAIQLRQPHVFAEFTATPRVAFHRYTFLNNGQPRLLNIDLLQGVGWDRLQDSHIEQESATVVSGYRISRGWASKQRVYFVAEFSQPVSVVRQQGDTILTVRVEDNPRPLLVKCALSAVSVENAKLNLKAELPGWNFGETVENAEKAWDEQLSKVAIETEDADARTIFYTALYHTMTAPSVFCDVNGQYRGSDDGVYSGNFTNYTTFSLWDTYRAAHPLMTILHTDRIADMAETMVNIYRQQGRLPVWHLMGCETDCMVGNPGVIALGDMVVKGLTKDPETAFQAMKASSMTDLRSINLLKQYGYLPYDKEPSNETVAKALEYCISDDAVAQVAKLLGHDDDYAYFHQRSLSYTKYFDSKTQFMRPIDAKGTFRTPFDPFGGESLKDYTEGNAWQYTWLVPHDVKGLVNLFGGEKRFVEKLDSLFIVEGNLGEEAPPDITGLIGQYAHGNEPSHHIIYLYNYVGHPEKSAPLLRKVMNEMYHNDFDGLSGNEDVGQMSAWYVLSAMGLYQVEPVGGKFIIGTPLFDEVTINLGNGRSFTINAHNNSASNIYVKSCKLNGQPLTRPYITYKEIMDGGMLELEMASED